LFEEREREREREKENVNASEYVSEMRIKSRDEVWEKRTWECVRESEKGRKRVRVRKGEREGERESKLSMPKENGKRIYSFPFSFIVLLWKNLLSFIFIWFFHSCGCHVIIPNETSPNAIIPNELFEYDLILKCSSTE
jgi:hypothetical protein